MTISPDGLCRRAGMLAAGNVASLGPSLAVSEVFAPQSILSARVNGRPLLWFLAEDLTCEPHEFCLDPRTELPGILNFAVTVDVHDVEDIDVGLELRVDPL